MHEDADFPSLCINIRPYLLPVFRSQDETGRVRKVGFLSAPDETLTKDASLPAQAKDIPVEAITEATQLYQELLDDVTHSFGRPEYFGTFPVQEFQLYVIRAQARHSQFNPSIKGFGEDALGVSIGNCSARCSESEVLPQARPSVCWYSFPKLPLQ